MMRSIFRICPDEKRSLFLPCGIIEPVEPFKPFDPLERFEQSPFQVLTYHHKVFYCPNLRLLIDKSSNELCFL
jgi:hypothetical protein